MKYKIRVWFALQGDVVPLIYVAEAMARHTATAHGTLTLHSQTLKALRPEFNSLLLDAARKNQLTVCNAMGRVTNANEIIESAQVPNVADVADVADAWNTLRHLSAKAKHLVEWAEARGDEFEFVETPGKVVDTDLRKYAGKSTDADYGEVIEQGYYRSSIGGGESEPWCPPTAETIALAPVETDKPGPVWNLKPSIQRAPGYRWPLYLFLKAAHIAGQPCPKARDVLDAWKLKPPPDVQAMPDGVKYNNGLGKPKEADLKAIQQAIKNLLN